MTYELALELKNAGFPQDGIMGRRLWDKPEWEIHSATVIERIGKKEANSLFNAVYEPTLSELISACGDNLDYMRKITIRTGAEEVTDGWEVGQKVDKGEDQQVWQEFELEEALVGLWLEINSQKNEVRPD